MRPFGVLPGKSCDRAKILSFRLGSAATRPRVAQA
jgi:hypothetical protein